MFGVDWMGARKWLLHGLLYAKTAHVLVSPEGLKGLKGLKDSSYWN